MKIAMQILIAALFLTVAGGDFMYGKTDVFLCEQCGKKFSSIASLTTQNCIRHPSGTFKGKHKLYEGGKKEEYMCKFCGKTFKSLETLTMQKCLRHPDGNFKGAHAVAL